VIDLRSSVALALAGLLLAACASASTPGPTVTVEWPLDGAGREMPPVGERPNGVPGPGGGTILRPVSAPIASGMAYRFTLGHCGLLSPIDVDGSFWDPVEGVSALGAPIELESDPEMINATGGTLAVFSDEMRFHTDGGSIVRFTRHDGAKEFPGCD
jgi:hypothetical protein